MTPHYHINLFWSEEDDSWIADVPDLQYCSAHGPTPDDALRAVKIAMDLWLDVARAHGNIIPEARYRPSLRQAA